MLHSVARWGYKCETALISPQKHLVFLAIFVTLFEVVAGSQTRMQTGNQYRVSRSFFNSRYREEDVMKVKTEIKAGPHYKTFDGVR